MEEVVWLTHFLLIEVGLKPKNGLMDFSNGSFLIAHFCASCKALLLT